MKRLIAIGLVFAMVSGCSMAPYSVKRYDDSISFLVKIPKAREVYFVSNLTDFRKVKAKNEGDGIWKATLPYRGGIIKYFYIADGRIYLPPCKAYERDDFGGKDCVYLPKM